MIFQVFPLIFTHDNICYQATNVIQTYYCSFLTWLCIMSLWQIFNENDIRWYVLIEMDRSSMKMISLICFDWNGLVIASHFSGFSIDMILILGFGIDVILILGFGIDVILILGFGIDVILLWEIHSGKTNQW